MIYRPYDDTYERVLRGLRETLTENKCILERKKREIIELEDGIERTSHAIKSWEESVKKEKERFIREYEKQTKESREFGD